MSVALLATVAVKKSSRDARRGTVADIDQDAALRLIREQGIVDVQVHPSCFDFKLGDGRCLALYPGALYRGGPDYAHRWTLESWRSGDS